MFETTDQILFAVDFKGEYGDIFRDMSGFIKKQLKADKKEDAFETILKEDIPEKILIQLDIIIACENFDENTRNIKKLKKYLERILKNEEDFLAFFDSIGAKSYSFFLTHILHDALKKVSSFERFEKQKLEENLDNPGSDSLEDNFDLADSLLEERFEKLTGRYPGQKQFDFDGISDLDSFERATKKTQRAKQGEYEDISFENLEKRFEELKDGWFDQPIDAKDTKTEAEEVIEDPTITHPLVFTPGDILGFKFLEIAGLKGEALNNQNVHNRFQENAEDVRLYDANQPYTESQVEFDQDLGKHTFLIGNNLQSQNPSKKKEVFIEESFDHKNQETTISVFSEDDWILLKAVELAFKDCPKNGRVEIDGANPVKALKVYLFAKAAGDVDKFYFSKETEALVNAYTADRTSETAVESERQKKDGHLKALYTELCQEGSTMDPKEIRKRLEAPAKADHNEDPSACPLETPTSTKLGPRT